MASGMREILLGLTVDRITGTFPQIKLAEAERDLKSDQPDLKELQDLKVPDSVGGEVDVLLGVQYLALYPTEVHSLDTGLTIYKLRIEGSKGYTATIAGPHNYFNHLAQKVGNVSHLLSKFNEGIKLWRKLGAPRPSYVPMNEEDLQFAFTANRAELIRAGVLEKNEDETDQTYSSCATHGGILKKRVRNQLQSDTVANFLDTPTGSYVSCQDCGEDNKGGRGGTPG